ncbi:MAG TPA: FAD-dependent oxidoreductase [Thermomicrobiaceae bacterium]|nr:FAD-dependent oxidoreductase [Thermomicrobiaceae bacterium]
MRAEERIRLLALVEIGFRPAHAMAHGPAYDVSTGDTRWFQDNIPCQAACPAGTDVPRYIALLADGRAAESDALNREHNILSGCLGRVCARPCEAACRRGLVDEPIAICGLKRAAYDLAPPRLPELPPRANGLSVGIVGAGPAGLAAARELAWAGFTVVIYERREVPGGMLWAGIPAWRLRRAIIENEVRAILTLGVEIRYGVQVGGHVALDELLTRHDALLLAAGCQDSVRLGIPGEELAGVAGGLPFLAGVNLDGGGAEFRGARVVTIGGGYTSLDCARTALRLGADESVLTYRRDEAAMPVAAEELREAAREGVRFAFLASPGRILGEGGRVVGVELERNRLVTREGECAELPPVPGSSVVLPCERVIVAIGQRQRDDLGVGGTVKRLRWPGVPAVDQELRTDHPRIWAAGDFVARPRDVISAIADGKRAAASIARALRGAAPSAPVAELTSLSAPDFPGLRRLLADGVADWTLTTLARRLDQDDDYLELRRRELPLLALAEREIGAPGGLTREVEAGFAPALAADEARRCLQCQLNIFIDGNACILCNGCVEVCPQQCIEMVTADRLAAIDGDTVLAEAAAAALGDSGAAMLIHEADCVRCGRCVERCPTGCLTLEHFRAVEPDVVPHDPVAAARGNEGRHRGLPLPAGAS